MIVFFPFIVIVVTISKAEMERGHIRGTLLRTIIDMEATPGTSLMLQSLTGTDIITVAPV